MEPQFFVIQFLNGLATASTLFIAACGLTIVFGVTRIVNFAHGSFYMLGAYIAVTLVPVFLNVDRSFPMFMLAVLLAALAVGVIGVVMEVLLLRRIYKVPELFQLLATFGVVLVVQDLVIIIWGPLEIFGPRVPGLRHSVEILGERFPAYELFLIGMGPLVLALLWLLMRRTRFGVLIRAATQDREMVGALGVNQGLLFTGTLFLGSFLAGLGGALMIPKVAANTTMDISIISEAFVVTVVGGMGSVPGAFLASVLVGQLQAFGILIFPKITLVVAFLLMAVVLVVRPYGLLGKPEIAQAGKAAAAEGIDRLDPWSKSAWAVVIAAFGALVVLPFVADDYILKVGVEVMVFAMLAFSLNFLMGNGGLVSFGHAAYFGIGAYAAGLLVVKLQLPMEIALVVAPLAGALGSLAFGYFIVRLSGIYLAMLTLACAQLVYAVAFQWVEVTGGDNGIVGVWPSAWAADRAVYFYVVLFLMAATAFALRRVFYAPFGYTLRAARDSAVRADSIGIDVRTHRLYAFTLAGACAGLAGALYAFSLGSISPGFLGIPTSVDALAMVLIGGIRTLTGPLAGSLVFHALESSIMTMTDYWRLVLGLVIIAIVLVFPAGLVGTLSALKERLGARTAPVVARSAE